MNIKRWATTVGSSALAVTGAVALMLGGVGMAIADSGPTTKEVDWVLAVGSTTASPFSGGPQHLFTGQCGTGIIQKDIYRYHTDKQRQLVDGLVAAGILDHYADSSVFVSVTWSQQTPCVPEKPVTPPTYSAWVTTGTPKCGDTTETQTRTEMDTDYTLEDNVWKSTVTTKTDTQTVPLTAAQLAALAETCTTSTPTPTPTQTPTPVVSLPAPVPATAPAPAAAPAAQPAAPVTTTARFTG